MTLVAFARILAQATPSVSHIAFALARARRSGHVKRRPTGWLWGGSPREDEPRDS
ncbi:MAG: hypothetical protein VYB31_02770 [Pseudomonadota bacterium]|nr:hypothetical protein [Pseudomonadota bacterium]